MISPHSEAGKFKDYYVVDSDCGEVDNELEFPQQVDDMLHLKSKKELPALVTKFAIPSGIGEPLEEELASSIGYLTSHQLNEKNMQDTAERYASPDNCQTLDVPKINATIWDNLMAKQSQKT